MVSKPRSLAQRRKSVRQGLEAEALVGALLARDGFEVLAERFKTKHGEIDIIARRDTVIVFIEVKARASVIAGLESVTARAQRRISDSAALWIAENSAVIGSNAEFRFDVAVVTPDHCVHVTENAFEAPAA